MVVLNAFYEIPFTGLFFYIGVLFPENFKKSETKLRQNWDILFFASSVYVFSFCDIGQQKCNKSSTLFFRNIFLLSHFEKSDTKVLQKYYKKNYFLYDLYSETCRDR